LLVSDRADLAYAGAALTVVAGGLEARIGSAAAVASTETGASSERARLEKELAQAETALAAARGRLADTAFLERAPAQVVEGARTREAELAERVARLTASLR